MSQQNKTCRDFDTENTKNVLLHLWTHLPATKNGDICTNEDKQGLYDQFINDCKDKGNNFPSQFDWIQPRYDFPWKADDSLADGSGRAWAKALAYATFVLRVGVTDSRRSIDDETSFSEVKAKVEGVFQQWDPSMDTILRDGWNLRKAELKEVAKSEGSMPQEFESKAGRI